MMLTNQQKNELINSLTSVAGSLSPRSQEVINQRFGLKTGEVKTLESIGKKYSITRERVRQIEEVALRDLRKNFDTFSLASWVSKVKDILRNHGQVIREDLLFEEFSGSPEYDKVNANLVFLMTVSSNFEHYPESENYFAAWSVKDPVYIQKAFDYIDKVVKAFKNRDSVMPEAELEGFFNKAVGDSINDKDVIFSYLGLSKLLTKNIFNQWGLVTWPDISPKGIKDKAYLVLKKEEKPLHFREIADLINSYKFDPKKANFQTVHNELIKDSRFVLVGRGLYALSEWGYEPGKVKDVVASLLKKHGPMTRDQIIAKTTEVRFVKPTTIVLNLQDKKFFKKDEEGNYYLVKA